MENILEILKRWNFWEKELSAGIARSEYIRRIAPFLDRKEILVLKGIRRSGKSTLMKQLMVELLRKGVPKKNVLYLNLEDFGFADHLSVQLFDDVLDAYRRYSKNVQKIFFFIDEIQKIPSWEKWVRTMYDSQENIKFVISGSSASLLSKELSTLLTGRNISFVVRPLSFVEYVAFTGVDDVLQYLRYGGFPEVVLEESEEKKIVLLQQYVEDIVHKDVIDRYAIRNTKQVFNLARYLISTSGSKLSVSKLSKVFGLSKETLQTYLNYLIDAYLLIDVPFFSFSAKTKHDVAKLPKMYSVDLGLVTAVETMHGKNLGQRFENAVLLRLIEAHSEVCYWADLHSEVDFIAGKNAINVTSTDRIPQREHDGLSAFAERHIGFSSCVIAHNLKKEGIVPLQEFLMNDAL